MALVVTDAIVLHAFDYLETSRIIRLVTRESGVVSVLAKGARRSRGRVGSAVDLFAEGEAQIHVRQTRELHTLAAFDVTRARAELALDLGRFLAASMISELVLRLGGAEQNPALYQTVSEVLDGLGQTQGEGVASCGLGGAWRIVAASGFSPALEVCASCHTEFDAEARVAFSPPTGGGLCERCARLASVRRWLPAEARAVLMAWLSGERDGVLNEGEVRAHQRLLREFLYEHLPDDRPLKAFGAWEGGGDVSRPNQVLLARQLHQP